MAKQKMMVMTCDNPSCDSKPQILYPSEPYALGYHLGKGSWHGGGGGGPIPAVFACSLDCLAPAVQHVIEESG